MLDHQLPELPSQTCPTRCAAGRLQGPKAMEILRRLAPEDNILKTKILPRVFDGEVGGIPCIISKTGYTGEDGVELYAPADQAEKLWDLLLETGRDDCESLADWALETPFVWKQPCRSTDMKINDDVTPLETGAQLRSQDEK